MGILRQDPRYSVLSFIEDSKHYEHRASHNYPGATHVLKQPLGIIPPFQFIKTTGAAFSSIELVRYDSGTSLDISAMMTLTGFENIEYDGTGGYGTYYLWSYPGSVPLPTTSVSEGMYYLRLQDHNGAWILSELFTFIDGLELRRDFVKVTWWNLQDFVIESEYVGETELINTHIRYVAPFKFYVYLPSHIARHGWQYDVDEVEREGVKFKKSITKFKEYSFQFPATEFLVDAMSFIPQHSKVEVSYDGQTYSKIYDFIPKPEPSGEMYGVKVTFTTNRTTTKLHSTGLSSTAYEAETCLTTQFEVKGIIVDGSAQHTGFYVTNELEENIDLETGDFVIVETSGFLRLKIFTGAGYSTPSYADYDNLFVIYDNRDEFLPLRVDSYYFIFMPTPYPAPFATTETIAATTTLIGKTYGNSLLQVILKTSDDEEWVAATVTDTVFKTTGATFPLTDGNKTGVAYKLRAASWRCPVVSESDWVALEGVDFDDIEGTLEVGSGGSETPTPDGEGG